MKLVFLLRHIMQIITKAEVDVANIMGNFFHDKTSHFSVETR